MMTLITFIFVRIAFFLLLTFNTNKIHLNKHIFLYLAGRNNLEVTREVHSAQIKYRKLASQHVALLLHSNDGRTNQSADHSFLSELQQELDLIQNSCDLVITKQNVVLFLQHVSMQLYKNSLHENNIRNFEMYKFCGQGFAETVVSILETMLNSVQSVRVYILDLVRDLKKILKMERDLRNLCNSQDRNAEPTVF